MQKLRGQQSIAIDDTNTDQENRDFQRMGWEEWRDSSRKDGYGCADVKNQESSSENGEKALMDAIHKGDTEMVKKLLERRINIEKPKALAEEQGKKSIHDLLLSYEMKIDQEQKLESSKGEKPNGETKEISYRNDSDQYCSSSIQVKPCKGKEKRVTIHMLSQDQKDLSQLHNGKLIILPTSLEELLRLAGKFSNYSNGEQTLPSVKRFINK